VALTLPGIPDEAGDGAGSGDAVADGSGSGSGSGLAASSDLQEVQNLRTARTVSLQEIGSSLLTGPDIKATSLVALYKRRAHKFAELNGETPDTEMMVSNNRSHEGSHLAMAGGLMCCVGLVLLSVISSQRRRKPYTSIGPRFAIV
jgi:hypothetical protein